jgi:hypothetical protein
MFNSDPGLSAKSEGRRGGWDFRHPSTTDHVIKPDEPIPEKRGFSPLVIGLFVSAGLGLMIAIAVIIHDRRNNQAAATPPVLPLWDFTTLHGARKEPLVPVKIRRKIDAAVMRQGGSSDAVLIGSLAEGMFTEGGKKQKVYTTFQYGRSEVGHISFFALHTDGNLNLIPNQYDGIVLRTVRLPDADVDYLVVNSEGGNNGDDLDYMRVVSLRDGEVPKVIADVGITSDNSCASGGPGAFMVASKVFYRPAGTAMEILPFEQYTAPCIPNTKFTFLKTTQDDAQKVELPLVDADRRKVKARAQTAESDGQADIYTRDQATQTAAIPTMAPTPDLPNSQSRESHTVTTPAESEAAQAQPSPKFTNCYDNSFLRTAYKETSETRQQFALGAAEKLEASGIYVSARGEDNKYLLMVATPDNEDALRQFAAGMESNVSAHANFCVQGFAEVQFIIRDANMNQKLIQKFQTNFSQSWQYLLQHGGATPVQ